MKRVDSPGSESNLFVDKNDGLGKPGTLMEQTWHNNVQEELCAVIEAAGIALSGADMGQLLKALNGTGGTLPKLKATTIQTSAITEISAPYIDVNSVLIFDDYGISANYIDEGTVGAGVTIEGILLKDFSISSLLNLTMSGILKTDVMNENTLNNGTVINGLKIKGSAGTNIDISHTGGAASLVTLFGGLYAVQGVGEFKVKTISESPGFPGVGVTIEGINCDANILTVPAAGNLKTDSISETTAANGIHIGESIREVKYIKSGTILEGNLFNDLIGFLTVNGMEIQAGGGAKYTGTEHAGDRIDSIKSVFRTDGSTLVIYGWDSVAQTEKSITLNSGDVTPGTHEIVISIAI